MIDQKEKTIKEFSLYNFKYIISENDKYLHDDDVEAKFFLVRLKNRKQILCSSFKSAKRGDTLFTKGTYFVNKNSLVFKEYNYNHQNERVLDSVIKTFVPRKNGTLILLETINYKNGIAKKIKF